MPDVNSLAAEFLAALRSADRTAARGAVLRASGSGTSPETLLVDMVIPGLIRLGEGWEAGHFSLTQVYMGGRIAEDIVAEVLPRPETPSVPWGRVVIGTLEDWHGMGQRIVASYLAVSGAEVVPLGIGVSAAGFVKAAGEHSPDLIAVSTLMYRSALIVRDVREQLDREGMDVPLLVGGAPFNMDRELWRRVGASAMGGNPAEGIDQAKRLVAERRRG